VRTGLPTRFGRGSRAETADKGCNGSIRIEEHPGSRSVVTRKVLKSSARADHLPYSIQAFTAISKTRADSSFGPFGPIKHFSDKNCFAAAADFGRKLETQSPFLPLLCGTFPWVTAFDGSDIWIANISDGTVSKLRPSDGATLGVFPAGPIPIGLAFDGQNIWVANQGGANTVTKLRACDGEARLSALR